MEKILEKNIAKQLSKFYKSYFKFYLGQIGAQKEESAIDTVIILLYIV